MPRSGGDHHAQVLAHHDRPKRKPPTITTSLHVQPLYLAGPGDIATATAPLIRYGWTQDPASTRLRLRSPCRTFSFEQYADGLGWRLGGVSRTTRHGSQFSRGTPAEVVGAAALATAHGLLVTAPIPPARPVGLKDLVVLLESSPWNRDECSRDGLGGTWVSPDLHGTVRFDRRASDIQWSITVNAGSDAGWKATFGHYVPSLVVRAALETTIGDRAVERRAGSLPAAHLTHLTTPTAAGLPADRIPAALSCSRPVRLNPRPASPPSPAAPAPAAGGRRR